MTHPPGEDNIREHLTAFADGELDAEQILAVLRYIKSNPESLDLIVEQQKLRVAAMRTVRQSTPPVPRGLRDRIASMAAKAASTTSVVPGSPTTFAPRARQSFWLLAAIVIFCVGIAVSYVPWRQGPEKSKTTATTQEQRQVPLTLVGAVTGVHVDCSRFAARLHAAVLPKEMAQLSAAIKQDYDLDASHPNLSKLNYKFVGAGPCRAPLENTAHLLYRSEAADVHDTISIFVQPASDRLPLESGKFYLVSDSTSPHPMFAWRTQRAVYFLVTDDMQIAERARTLVASAITP